MPLQIAYLLEQIIEHIKEWDFSGKRRVSSEYIVFGELNDFPKHATELARLFSGIKCRVNLIRFHPIPGTPRHATDEETLQEFKDALNNKGILTTIRTSCGAACGLLSTKAFVNK